MDSAAKSKITRADVVNISADRQRGIQALWEIAYQLAVRNEEAAAYSKMQARMLEIAEADRAFREKVSQRQEANLEQINKVMEMASHFGLAPKPAAEPSTGRSIDGIPRDANGKPIEL